MKTSIFFIIAFVVYMVFGKGLENWHDWFFGVAFGVSVCNLTWFFLHRGAERDER